MQHYARPELPTEIVMQTQSRRQLRNPGGPGAAVERYRQPVTRLGVPTIEGHVPQAKACPVPGGSVAQTEPFPWHHQEPDELLTLVGREG